MKPFCRNLAMLATGCALALGGAAHAASSRYSWVIDSIHGYNHPFAAQLPGELKIKMQKMRASPFAFYRGTAHLFFADMATLPASAYAGSSTAQTWLNGDMHLANLGAFRDDSGNFVYDTTDFDEGYWGQYVWDLRRMAVSIVLAARENGLSSARQEQLVRDFADAYFNKIGEFRGTNDELNYRLTTSNTSGVVKDTIQSSADQTRSALLAKYTALSNNRRVFLTTGELQTVSPATYSAIQSALSAYVNTIPSSKRYAGSYYAVKDVRIKLASGVGSLGRYRYYVLVEGASTSQSDDVILQVKQESASVVSVAAPGNFPTWAYGYHEGQRAARSMKANLSNTDRLAGWATIGGSPFFVREKSPYEKDFDYKQLTSYDKFSTAVQYMGKVVAKNHAISDKDYDSTLIPYSNDKEIDDWVNGHKPEFKSELVDFAANYARQVELDHQGFADAYDNGVPLY